MKTVTPNQSNHHCYLLPNELKNTSEKRLYMNVALWALKQKQMVCNQDIAAAFGISNRQATNILSIITRRYSNTIISSVKTVKVDRTNVNYILITEILPGKQKNKKRSSIDKNTSSIDEWKKQFLFGTHSVTDAVHPSLNCKEHLSSREYASLQNHRPVSTN